MEGSSERPQLNPREDSKGFLKRYKDNVIGSLSYINVGMNGFLAGINIDRGNNKVALINGLAAGCFAAVGIMNEIKMGREKQALKDKVADLESRTSV